MLQSLFGKENYLMSRTREQKTTLLNPNNTPSDVPNYQSLTTDELPPTETMHDNNDPIQQDSVEPDQEDKSVPASNGIDHSITITSDGDNNDNHDEDKHEFAIAAPLDTQNLYQNGDLTSNQHLVNIDDLAEIEIPDDFNEFKKNDIDAKLRAGLILTSADKKFIKEMLGKTGIPEDQIDEELINYMGVLYREYYGCHYILYFLQNLGALALEFTYALYTIEVANLGIQAFCNIILGMEVSSSVAESIGIFLGAGAFIPDLTTFDIFSMTNELIVQYAENPTFRAQLDEIYSRFRARPDTYNLIVAKNIHEVDPSTIAGNTVVIVPANNIGRAYFIRNNKFIHATTAPEQPDEFVTVMSHLTPEEKQYIRFKQSKTTTHNYLTANIDLTLAEQTSILNETMGKEITRTAENQLLINSIISKTLYKSGLINPTKTLVLGTLASASLLVILIHNLTGAYADILGVEDKIPKNVGGYFLRALMLFLGNQYYNNFLTPKYHAGLVKHGFYPFNKDNLKNNSLLVKFKEGDYARASNVAFQIFSATLLRSLSFGFLVPLIQADMLNGIWFPRSVVYPAVILHTLLSRFFPTFNRYYGNAEKINQLIHAFPELIDIAMRKYQGIAIADMSKLENSPLLKSILAEIAQQLRQQRSYSEALCEDFPSLVLGMIRTLQMSLFIGGTIALIAPNILIPEIVFYIGGGLAALCHYYKAESRRIDDALLYKYLENLKPELAKDIQNRTLELRNRSEKLAAQAEALQTILGEQKNPTLMDLQQKLDREATQIKLEIIQLQNRANLLPIPKAPTEKKVETVSRTWKETASYVFIASTTAINNAARSISASAWGKTEGAAIGISDKIAVPGATLLAAETGVNGYFTMIPNTYATFKHIWTNTKRLGHTLVAPCLRREAYHVIRSIEPTQAPTTGKLNGNSHGKPPVMGKSSAAFFRTPQPPRNGHNPKPAPVHLSSINRISELRGNSKATLIRDSGLRQRYLSVYDTSKMISENNEEVNTLLSKRHAGQL